MCILTFSGNSLYVQKVKRLLDELKLKTDNGTAVDSKLTDDVDETKSKADMAKRRKTTITTITLTDDDKDVITKGSEFTDMHINFFQQLLRQQFPSIQGLRSSLSPVVNIGTWVSKYMQIFTAMATTGFVQVP